MGFLVFTILTPVLILMGWYFKPNLNPFDAILEGIVIITEVIIILGIIFVWFSLICSTIN